MKVSKNKAKRDFVKFEIYNYPKTKRDVENWHAFDTTTAVIDHKKNIVDAVEKALNQIKQDGSNGVYKEKLINFYFWQKSDLTICGLALNQYVHRNTAQTWINDFVNKVGENLGLFDYHR